LKRIKRNHYRG